MIAATIRMSVAPLQASSVTATVRGASAGTTSRIAGSTNASRMGAHAAAIRPPWNARRVRTRGGQHSSHTPSTPLRSGLC